MKFSNVLSLATFAYATSVTAYGNGLLTTDGDDSSPSTGGGSTLPSNGDSTVPSTGDTNSPSTGGTSPVNGGDDDDDDDDSSTTTPPSTGGGGGGGGSDSTTPPSTGGGSTTTPPNGNLADFQPAVSCRNNICYSAVVPSTTARSGAGPIWFQIYAPTTFSWVGFGTGTSMADSNMFIMYQDGNGNVTLSHRQASGRVPPEVPADSSVTTTLLGGSGVGNGFMVANFRCDNCTTWKRTESLVFTSQGTPMVGAWSEGDSLDSTDVDEAIAKHTGQIRSFSLDLNSAQKASAGNPFVGNFAVPEEIASGGATNNTDGDDDGDDNAEAAAVGNYGYLSGSVAVAAVLTGLSLGK